MSVEQQAAQASGTAWLFPGQGSQVVGMARDLHAADPAVRRMFEEASSRVGFDVAARCFDGPADELQRTEIAQPCLLTASVAFARALHARGQAPSFVAGHSLGEYSALVEADVLSFGDAVWAVRRRGELMATAEGGAMAAILGLSDALVQQACAESAGTVVPANFNAPGQVVISGSPDAVAAASDAAKRLGAVRVVSLRVSGAFHSPLMQPAAQELEQALHAVSFNSARVPVVCNVSAELVEHADRFAPLLVRQVAEPVRWTAVMTTLLNQGVRRFVEVGPGRVLAGLARQIDRGVEVVNVGTLDSLDKMASAS